MCRLSESLGLEEIVKFVAQKLGELVELSQIIPIRREIFGQEQTSLQTCPDVATVAMLSICHLKEACQ